MSRHRFAIIGVGMVGRTLAKALAARRVPVAAMAARRPDAVQQAAAEVACPLATTDPAEAAGAADVVVLAVPDDAIAAVCQQIAAGGGFEPGDVALHLSGACPSAILAPAAAAGAACLAFHPIQTFARVDPALLQGITCMLEGDDDAVAFGQHLARALGCRAVRLAAADKPLYHAALSIASNYLVALADSSAELLAAAGLGDAALQALLPLLQGTLDNLSAVGLPQALTGPLARGDARTVEAHLAALRTRAPHLLPLYRVLGIQTLAVARRKGTLDDAMAARLERLLSGR